MKRFLTIPTLLVSLASVAQAQTTYITSDRTIAGGNPINTPITGAVYIGQNNSGNTVLGVDADFVTGASTTGAVVGSSNSITNIYAGTYGSIAATDTAQITVAAVNLTGGYQVTGNGILTVAGGRASDVYVSQNGTARINGGIYVNSASFTLMEASGANALLEINGGTTGGVVRAAQSGVTRVSGGDYGVLHALPGGMLQVSGGIPASGARFAALNRGAGDANRGRFQFFGSNLTLSNPTAGSYYDPTYLISSPGVFFTLSGTLANGQSITAQYFEEGITVNDQPTQIQFASVVPEPSALILFALPILGSATHRLLYRKKENSAYLTGR